MRAQASFEYLMTVGFIFMLVTGMTAGIFYVSQRNTVEIQTNQLLAIGNKMAVEVQSVFAEGRDTRSSFTAQFPPGVDRIEFVSYALNPGGEFLIFLEDHAEPTFGFPVSVPVEFDPDSVLWGSGSKKFSFFAKSVGGNLLVNVTIT